MPNALQRTLTTALGAGTGPTYDLYLPESVTAPVVKESPVERIRSIAAKHPVPYAWEAALRRIAPINTETEWLAFRWCDGSEKDPINRWVLYGCLPKFPTHMRDILGGTPWWEMPKGEQVGRRMMCSAYQWEMYRKHRVWARPFWCLQGTDGGTPAVYGELEKKLMRLEGLSTDPPAYGSLPYAEWNALTERRIREREQLWSLGRKIAHLTASGVSAALKADTEEAERQFRIRFLAWIKERFAAQADFLEWYTRKTEADMTLRKATEQEVAAAETHDERFITTGAV